MTRFIIFVCLLAVQFNRGTSEKVHFFEVGRRARIYVQTEKTAESCIINTNKNVKYTYDPSTTREISNNLRSVSRYGKVIDCTFEIDRVSEDEAGSWKITAITKQEDSNKPRETVFQFKIYSTIKKNVKPFDRIKIYPDQYLNIKFPEEFANLTACNLTDPLEREFDLLNAKPNNIQLFGQCGVRILMTNKSLEGDWTLQAIVNDSIAYQASVTVQLIKEKPKTDKEIVFHMERGKQNSISIGPSVSFCQLTDPHGIRMPLTNGRCEYDIPFVTSQLEGIWTARYGIEGKSNVEEIKFKVETYDVPRITTNVHLTKEGDAKLICRTQKRYSLLCRFIKPDGTTINISPGIGNDRYFSYLEVADRSRDISECGLMISKPNLVDYGTWKCEMTAERGKYVGAILKLRNPFESRDAYDNVNTRGGAVQVKQGDSFQIKCYADDKLDYCRLRSPTGTSFFVTEEKNPNAKFTLEYEGVGLSLGECGATIKAANYTDQGKWSCFMGVVNGSEVEATVSVTVTESYVIALKEVITLSNSVKPILSCYILPNMLEKEVDYCRWSRPDGHGIHNSVPQRYLTQKNNTHCALTILGNIYPEDIGRWTCVAGLTGNSLEEAFAYIELRSDSMQLSTLIALITGAGALLTLTACAFILINIRNRRRSLPKKPPPYNPEDFVPPKSLKQDNNVKEYQY